MIPTDTATHCPACQFHDTHATPYAADIPEFLFPLPKEVACSVDVRTLTVSACSRCGHLFQRCANEALLKKIYGEFYAYYPYDSDENMLAYYRRPFDVFFAATLAKVKLTGGNLLEVGCSAPKNLKPFADRGFQCVGVDPSPLAEVTCPKHVKMVSGFYEDVDLDRKFDMIVSRFNLEHIIDIDQHVAKMADDIADAGTIVVQVPNAEAYIDQMQPNHVAHEHIHYFSRQSLDTLFGRYGFTRIHQGPAQGPSILAAFRRGEADIVPADGGIYTKYLAYAQTLEQIKADLARELHAIHKPVFYGVGMTLYWVLGATRGSHPDARVIDDNSALVGLVVPGFGLVVETPGPALLEPCDALVLTLNPLFHEKVIASIGEAGKGKQVISITQAGVRVSQID